MEGDQALICERVDGYREIVRRVPRREGGREESLVLFAASSVGDHIELLRAEAGDDCVVYNATSLGMKESGQGGLMGRKRGKRGRRDRLEECSDAWTFKVVLNPWKALGMLDIQTAEVELTYGSHQRDWPFLASTCATRLRQGLCTVLASRSLQREPF